MASTADTEAPIRTRFLRGDFFKIILTDARAVTVSSRRPRARPTGDDDDDDLTSVVSDLFNEGADSGMRGASGSTVTSQNQGAPLPLPPPSPPEYFIHKSLLESLSMELYKHANNEMKEGRENVIELSEVDEPTLESFLEWAYYKDYNDVIPKGPPGFLAHTKVYVLADRFNIPTLKDLAFSKISTLFADMGMVKGRSDILAMTDAVAYAYDNLPLRGSPRRIIGASGDVPPAPTERLLKYFAEYIAWALELFRFNDEFMRVAGNSDLAEALLVACRPALSPPWVSNETTGATAPDPKDKVTLDRGDRSHALYRKCRVCSYAGIMGVQCSSCEKYDHETGSNVRLYGSHLTVLGGQRVTGTHTNYNYTCKWCEATNTYNTSKRNFTAENGSSMEQETCHGYLWCLKCQVRGYKGDLTESGSATAST